MAAATIEQRIERRISTAQDELTIENRRILAEIEAFEEFVDRLESDVTLSRPAQTTSGMRALTEQPRNSGTGELREAYESTVMSVSHFSEDYDETFYENLTAEFGAELAAMIYQAGHIDEQCKSAVESLSITAIHERENLAETIQAEQESIDTISSQLHDIAVEIDSLSTIEFVAKDFGGLEAFWTRLQTLEDKCDTIADERQETIRSHSRKLGTDNSETCLSCYLYKDLTEAYPILASIGILGIELTALQSEIEAIIMYLPCHRF